MQVSCRMILTVALCAVLLHPTWAQAPAEDRSGYTPSVGQEGKDVVWVPTPQALVDRMLDAAQLSPGDYLVDLGSGDGRTVITAAKRGTRAHGIEFNPDMVYLSRRSAEIEGVSERATFEEGDIFESNFTSATVVTLFLLSELNLKLRPTLLEMKPGTRVLSNAFSMGDWKADETVEAQGDCSSYCRAYKWIVPAKVEGTWRLANGELTLTQSFQMLEGTLRAGDKPMPIREARLSGASIEFSAGDRRYRGQVDGDGMRGSTDHGGSWSATRSRR